MQKGESPKKKPKLDPIPEIEEYILSVINEAETEDKKITVTDIKNKAVAFAKENGNPTFNPSKGWILRFLQRHGKKLPEKNKNSKGEEVSSFMIGHFRIKGATSGQIESKSDASGKFRSEREINFHWLRSMK